MENFELYNDIAVRTNGNIYVGVVGPVRTGKSTFIKKVMEEIVLDNIADEQVKQRAIDEMPQSADGKMVMTTQPNFVPNEAIPIVLDNDVRINLRMVDCVGYLVDGALGDTAEGRERMVNSPWFAEPIPFKEAAEYGTRKVITEHSTIAILMTTDGSIGEIPRESYVPSERQVAEELTKLGKPFCIVINTTNPKSNLAMDLVEQLKAEYNAPVIAQDVMSMDSADISKILKSVLLEFPIKRVDFAVDKWMQTFDRKHPIITELMVYACKYADKLIKMSDYQLLEDAFAGSEYFINEPIFDMDMANGILTVRVPAKEGVFYNMLSKVAGCDIIDEMGLMSYVARAHIAENEYSKLSDAIEEATMTGYGIVNPSAGDLELEEPTLVKKNGRYGLMLKASASSMHLVRVNIQTEVNPIVGSEEQSRELVEQLVDQYNNNKEQLWETNIFGKSLNSLVQDGLSSKIKSMPDEAKIKMRKTIGRIVNEGHGGVICILL